MRHAGRRLRLGRLRAHPPLPDRPCGQHARAFLAGKLWPTAQQRPQLPAATGAVGVTGGGKGSLL